jgi:hypothetical protein
MSLLNAWEHSVLWQISFGEAWWKFLKGIHPEDYGRLLNSCQRVTDDAVRSDFWLPTILGSLELVSYPVLLQIGSWTAIGAWIGFKTVAQWNVWTKNRSQFNRYLIGNALVVIGSLVLSIWFLAPLHLGF